MGIQTSFLEAVHLTGSLDGTASYAYSASGIIGGNVPSSSYSQTASYINITGSGVLVTYNGDEIQLTGSTFPFTGSAAVSGGLELTGSLEVSGTIKSNALAELTASQAISASYYNVIAGPGVTVNYSASSVQVTASAAALPIPTGSLQARFIHAGTIYEISPSYQTNTFDLYNLGTVIIQSGSQTASFGDLMVSDEAALFSEYLYNAGTIINNGTLQVAPNVKR
jgi:hypothetical protein